MKKSNRQTLNPYVAAAGLVYRRLVWDLDYRSWASRRRLAHIKNSYVGKKAVILCNGPSLNDVPLETLGGVFTFGLNKINLIFDRTEFRPSCVVAVNPYVIQQNSEFFNKTQLPVFLDSIGKREVRFRDNITFLHSTSSKRIALDCSVSVEQGYTVTVVAMQLALHMGFSEVTIVGCDHNFATKGAPNKAIHGEEKDVNHFDDRYFSGLTWQLPDLAASEFYYTRVREAYESQGVKIYNSTVGGRLELFERKELLEFLS